MNLPRRLYKTVGGPVTKAAEIVEESDLRAAWNWLPKGYPLADHEAERIGLKAYLDRTGWGDVANPPEEEAPLEPVVKAVEQSTTEDKAVAGQQEAKAVTPADEGHKAPVGPDEKLREAANEMPDDKTKAPPPPPPHEDDPGKTSPGLHIDPALRRGRR